MIIMDNQVACAHTACRPMRACSMQTYACIQHADPWTDKVLGPHNAENNIPFRCLEQNGPHTSTQNGPLPKSILALVNEVAV
jgi:hypothetical protein